METIIGAPAAFSVTVIGKIPMTFQWQFNGADITGATSSSFAINNAQTGQAGNYSVVIRNVVGSVTSDNASLRVIVPPGIQTQPASQTVPLGNNVTFKLEETAQPLPALVTGPLSQLVARGANVTLNVVAQGTALTYQWFTNGVALLNATNPTLIVNNVQDKDAVDYTVRVTSGAGATAVAIESLAARTQIGNTATLSEDRFKDAPRLDGGSPARAGLAGNPVKASGGSVARLTVNTPLAITTQPDPQSVKVGERASFQVVVSGTEQRSDHFGRDKRHF